MAARAKVFHNAAVFYDHVYTYRLYDAIGPGVVKYVNDFAAISHVSSTPTEWATTAVGGGSYVSIGDEAGGVVILSTGTVEHDGLNLQLGTANGESIQLDKPLYCGLKVKLSDATRSTFFFGVGVTDTLWRTGLTDGLYFRKANNDAAVYLVSEKDSTEWTKRLGSLTDDVYVTLECWYDGSDSVTAYLDGKPLASFSIASNRSTWPDDELLRLTLEFKAGNAETGEQATIDWIRMVHLRGA